IQANPRPVHVGPAGPECLNGVHGGGSFSGRSFSVASSASARLCSRSSSLSWRALPFYLDLLLTGDRGLPVPFPGGGVFPVHAEFVPGNDRGLRGVGPVELGEQVTSC